MISKRFCSKCGKEIAAETRFCQFCGEPCAADHATRGRSRGMGAAPHQAKARVCEKHNSGELREWNNK